MSELSRPGNARGVVVTSHPLAVQAGTDVLDAGGSAADAAVAAAAVLTVVDPRSTGLGGDLFAMCWAAGEEAPVGLAAAGVSAAALSTAALRAAGFTEMPRYGPWTVTVPGAPAGWQALLAAYGRLAVADVLAAAVAYARHGHPVAPIVAQEWASATARLSVDPTAAALFLPGGRPPQVGDVVTNPDLASTLELFVAEGAAPFYTGRIAAAIGAAVEAAGGPLRAEDLAGWAGPEWVEPITRSFRGVDVYELPPPGQGVVVLEALGLLDAFAAGGRAQDDHRMIEALKLAIDDAAAVVTDPHFSPDRSADLLGEDHLERRRHTLGPAAAAGRSAGLASDTVYVAVVDSQGNGCSLIQSLYEGFGSGVGVPGTGLVLQNRGAGFVLHDGHPNRPEPGKRPFHTIIPAMLGRDRRLQGCLGVVGGYMQPQGQVQVLRNLLEHGQTAQEAVASPRLRVFEGTSVHAEPSYDADVLLDLARRGHQITPLARFEAGGAQLIWQTPSGFEGGSDPRKDGVVGRSAR